MDGLNLKFEYRALGDGDVDYPEILRRLQDHRSDAVLSIATHFIPPGGTRIDAMRINYQRLSEMIRKVQAGAISNREGGKA